jgi:RNA 2',3'-cyclic 3'-phosphodiesterase
MRLFVAVEVDPGAPGPSAERAKAPRHLTLRFLGEVAPDRLPSITTALQRVAHETPVFDLVVEGVGAFPSRTNPRVVWVGVTTGQRELVELADRISRALSEAGVEVEHDPLVPHLTLFRVRSPMLRRRATELLSGTTPPPPAERQHVTEFVLKQSTLAPEGALHRTLVAFPLGSSRSEIQAG